MNSFRFLERGIEAEIARQEGILAEGGEVEQETLHFDPDSGSLTSLRSKEEAHDYRYFPEPDLVPIAPTDEMLERARAALPELPAARAERFERELALPADTARLLAFRGELGDFYEAALASDGEHPRRLANWAINELTAAPRGRRPGRHQARARRARAAGGAGRGQRGVGRPPRKRGARRADRRGRRSRRGRRGPAGSGARGRTSSSEIVDRAIAANPDAVEKIKAGKGQAIGALVGAVMRETKGRADGGEVQRLIRAKLGRLTAYPRSHGATDPDGRHRPHDAGGVDRGRRSAFAEAVGEFRSQLELGYIGTVAGRPRQGHARARAAARGRPRDHAPPDRGRLVAAKPQALPELATVPWRARTDARWLRRWQRVWHAWTLLYTVPFLAAAAGMLWLDPITAPVAFVAVAHAWIIPELYASRGATVAAPEGAAPRAVPSRWRRDCSATCSATTSASSSAATGLALERGELGVWLVGEVGALLVTPGGRRVHCFCVRADRRASCRRPTASRTCCSRCAWTRRASPRWPTTPSPAPPGGCAGACPARMRPALDEGRRAARRLAARRASLGGGAIRRGDRRRGLRRALCGAPARAPPAAPQRAHHCSSPTSNFLLYTPLLPGAAAGSLEPRHVVVPLREELEWADIRLGRVTGADPARNELTHRAPSTAATRRSTTTS